ncbi:MAG: hypothetical protein IPH94_21510 [Saprospiraceae bacterium]|nr:hypothetical protein [Saprospiraceae bacterium]
MTSIVLEIVRYTVPSLVVFLTIYFLLNRLFRQQMYTEQLRFGSKRREKTEAVKMQAYERLILLCERIDPQQLFLRLNTGEMTAREMQQAMLVAVSQEFTHNYTQQLYVSANLWKIIVLSKDQIMGIISETAAQLQPGDPAVRLLEMLGRVKTDLQLDPLEQAKTAIKNEADLLLS